MASLYLTFQASANQRGPFAFSALVHADDEGDVSFECFGGRSELGACGVRH
jgi:hypothetical protein